LICYKFSNYILTLQLGVRKRGTAPWGVKRATTQESDYSYLFHIY